MGSEESREPWSKIERARQHILVGQRRAARDLLIEAVEADVTSSGLFLRVGDCYALLNNDHDARTYWRVAMSRASIESPIYSKACKRLATDASSRGEAKEAISLMERYLELQPSDKGSAIKLLTWQLAEAPTEERGDVLLRHQRQFSFARHELFEAAIALPFSDPARAEQLLFDRLGDLVKQRQLAIIAVDSFLEAGQIATAVRLAEQLFELNGAGSKELSCLLRAYKAEGRGLSEMLKIYDAHLRRHPHDRSNRLKKGKLLLQLRRWQAVVDESMLILEMDPTSIPAGELAVQALLRLDRPEQANALRDEVSKAYLDRHPENALPLIALDLAASAPRAAVERAAQFRQTAENSPHVDKISADALIAHGSYREAVDLLIEPINHSDDMLARAKAIQCSAALRAAGRSDVRFPDELFRLAISQDRPIQPWNSTAILVTSTLGAGGAERQVAITASRSAARLAARGLSTVLMCRDLREEYSNAIMLPMLTGYDVQIVDLYQHDPAVVFRNLCAQHRLSNDDIRLISGFPINLRRAIIQMYEQFVALKPRAVHLWQDGVIAVGSVAAVMAGVPHICASVRNVVAPESDTRRYRPFLAAVYTSLAKRPNVILTANSDVGARDYEEKFGLTHGSIRTIRNALDIDALIERRGPDGRSKTRAEMGYSDGEVVLGGTFRLVPAKRPHRWLDVAAKVGAALPNARFMIVGDGPMRADLETYAETIGIGDRVRLVGRKSPVEPWIAAMDLMLLASELEGLPNVLIEAQALGVPVVTTNAGGSAEALSEGITGTVVMTDSVDDLARECLAFLRSKEKQERARHEGPIFIRGRFGVERMVNETLSAYRESDEDDRFAAAHQA